MSIQRIKSPFPWFGGKSRVAKIIWSGLGHVSNYVEPFAGSLAVLLNNPIISKIETINDLDCGLSNFWRAVSIDSEKVAQYANYPVSEIDLHARHKWLSETLSGDFKNKMINDSDFYDPKAAGYWVWGVCCSVGDNWLKDKGMKALPLLSSAGGGINGLTYNLMEDFKKLQVRLRRVRVACGDWKRVMSPSITFNNKGLSPKDITGVFLDPPYLSDNRDKVYKEDNNVYKEVCEWAIENGDNPKLRIALCGYEGDYSFPETWKMFSWRTNGGLANLGNDRGKDNSNKERIYFSQYCL